MRPSIRLAALMKQQVVYVFTHDSIGLGEDGPTHQPVEQLSALRAIPNLCVIRPADANETSEAWRCAISRRNGPTALILTRQKLALIDRTQFGSASGVSRGAYVLADAPEGTLKAVILASGSEVGIALTAWRSLTEEGIGVRVVSFPSHELFAQQSSQYVSGVLPRNIRRIAIEAAHPMSWYRWVGDDGAILGIETFGASAPYERLYREYGLTPERLIETVKAVLAT
jgi:transketolase